MTHIYKYIIQDYPPYIIPLESLDMTCKIEHQS